MRHERSCGIVTFREPSAGLREYLLLHYPGGHWDFPKGHVERGETEEETARRELAEETGIEGVDLVPGFRHIIRYRFNSSRGRAVQKQVVFFAGRVAAKDVELSHEHKGFQWLPYRDAMDKLTFDNARQLLRAVDTHLAHH